MTTKVTVAIFTDRHGDNDTRVYVTEALAKAWLYEISDELWANELIAYPNRVRPENLDEAAQAILDTHECGFEWTTCDVIGA